MAELGDILVRAREERGLTLEDAERDTRIAKRYLEALEAEAFDAIPAPVYARGFLRSYSQYLGLDPQEMLALFPRPEDMANREPPPRRQERRAAPPPEPPPRRREAEPTDAVIGGADTPPTGQQPTLPPPPPPNRPRDGDYEPVIGVDIGVPSPATRINVDPAASTRTLFVAGGAIALILVALVIAFFVARAGGDDGNENGGPFAPDDGSTATTTAEAGETTTPAAIGTVPNVVGMTLEEATSALSEAGYEIDVIRQTASDPADTVIEQNAAGTQQPAGFVVTIVVSDGPG